MDRYPEQKMQAITHFRSGAGRNPDLHATIDSRQAVGVVAARMTPWQINQLVGALKRHVPVFVDSGAFSEIRSGKEPDWDQILWLYQHLARTGGSKTLSVVAPDKVGDQEWSMIRLRRAKAALNELRDLGVDVIVPYQSGARDPETWAREVTAILPSFRVGIPSNAAAVAAPIAGRLLAQPGVTGAHLLGISESNRNWAERVKTILAAAGPIDPPRLTADANRITAGVGQGRPITEGERDRYVDACCDVWDHIDLESLTAVEWQSLLLKGGVPSAVIDDLLPRLSARWDVWSAESDEDGRAQAREEALEIIDDRVVCAWVEDRNQAWIREQARYLAVRTYLTGMGALAA